MLPNSTRSRARRSTAWLVVAGCFAGATMLQAQSPADATAAGSADRTGSRATAAEEGGRPALGNLGGLRPWLDERGMTLEGFLLADLSRNFQGGITTGRETLRHLFEVSFTLDSAPLFHFSGGTLFLDFQTQEGRHGSELLVGTSRASPMSTVPASRRSTSSGTSSCSPADGCG